MALSGNNRARTAPVSAYADRIDGRVYTFGRTKDETALWASRRHLIHGNANVLTVGCRYSAALWLKE
jgi:hypothetical protein